MKDKEYHNAACNCLHCPSFNSENTDKLKGETESRMIRGSCRRRPGLGTISADDYTFAGCPQWEESSYGYLLKNMRILILGMDGYLGWSLALWLSSLGCQVSGVDFFYRRRWVEETGSDSIVPIATMAERLEVARKELNSRIDFREFDICDRDKLHDFIKEIQPECVVHYAECPSAPYSMIDFEHASFVQRNNVIGTLNLLFALRDLAPNASLIKLGTMGEYGTPLNGRPIFEGFFPDDSVLRWNGQEWPLAGELTPRDPGSFYHISKVQDTINVFKACRFWNLRSYDVMQGIIYGVHTEHTAAHEKLRTRYDIDECFGTVINRFVAQAVIGFPLTIFGTGEQIRGFIALEDAMQCITRLIARPPLPGRYEVVNQMSGYFSMKTLSETVRRIGNEKFDLNVQIQRVENPRVEAPRHPFEPVYDRLKTEFGYVQTDDPETEISRMFELLLQPNIKKRIEAKRDIILPKTWWSGERKQVARVDRN